MLGGASLVAQMVKNLPAMQEIHVRSLSSEDPLEEETATHSSILAWRLPWSSLVDYSPWGCRVGHNLATNTYTFLCLLTKLSWPSDLTL